MYMTYAWVVSIKYKISALTRWRLSKFEALWIETLNHDYFFALFKAVSLNPERVYQYIIGNESYAIIEI